MNSQDAILFALRNPCEITDFRLEFRRDVSLTLSDGTTTLRFLNPAPLKATFALITEDPGNVVVYDARLAQRERQRVRVSFLTGEGQEMEFWAHSVERLGA